MLARWLALCACIYSAGIMQYLVVRGNEIVKGPDEGRERHDAIGAHSSFLLLYGQVCG